MKLFYQTILIVFTAQSCDFLNHNSLPSLYKSFLGATVISNASNEFQIIGNLPDDNSEDNFLNIKLILSANKDITTTSIDQSLITVTSQAGKIVTGTITASNRFLTFKPTSQFDPNVKYSLKLSKSLKSKAGEALNSEYKFTFTTGANGIATPPVPSTANATSNLPYGAILLVNFSTSINPESATNNVVVTDAVTGSVILGTINAQGNAIYFTPTNPLPAGTNYIITLNPGIQDLAGNATTTTFTANFSPGGGVSSVTTGSVGAPSSLIYTGSPYTFTNGIAITTQTPTVTGTVTSCSASPTLPTGLSINNTTCAISGTPTVNQGATSYTITASNSGGNVTVGISIGVNAKLPLKTGQTTCWNGLLGSGTTISCSGTGQDGETQYGTAPSFTGPTLVGTSDYITKDNNTGLVWKACTEGLSGSSCGSGLATTVPWSTASTTSCSNLNSLNAGAGYANRTNWRLPSIEELEMLNTYSGVNPAIYPEFPGTASSSYWSNTVNSGDSNQAWSVDFNYILNWTRPVGKGNSNYVRCISGISVTPTPSFVDNSDGTILDSNTGLLWQKCESGNSGTNCQIGSTQTYNTMNSALLYCKTLNLGNKSIGSWRLPSVNELKSILDRATYFPALNTAYFQNASTSGFYYVSSSHGIDQANTLAKAPLIVKFDFYGETITNNSLIVLAQVVRCAQTSP